VGARSQTKEGSSDSKPDKPDFSPLLTPKETAERLKVSTSFLAKKRMDGTGPPFSRVGRSIRYFETGLAEWVKSG
jgi:hypothetical protein